MTSVRGIDQVNALMANMDGPKQQGLDIERIKMSGSTLVGSGDVAMKRDKRSSSSASSSSSKKSSKTSKRKSSEAAIAAAAAYESSIKQGAIPGARGQSGKAVSSSKQKQEEAERAQRALRAKQAAVSNFIKRNAVYSLKGFNTKQDSEERVKDLSINVAKMLKDSNIPPAITQDFANLLKIAMNMRLRNILLSAGAKRLSPTAPAAQIKIPSTPLGLFPQLEIKPPTYPQSTNYSQQNFIQSQSQIQQAPSSSSSLLPTTTAAAAAQPPPPPTSTSSLQQQQQQRLSVQQKTYQRSQKNRNLERKFFVQAMGPPIEFSFPTKCVTEDSLKTALEINPHLAITGNMFN